jgi:predicted MFS family arabinose efflux permease
MGQGFGWLYRNRPAGHAVMLLAATSMVAQALIMVFLVEAHSRQLSTLGIGVVLAASGAGGAAGSFNSRFLSASVRRYWLTIQMTAWSGVLALLVIAGGQPAFWNTVAMFTLGFTGAIGNIEVATYLTRRVDDGMVAKVTGIGQMLSTGASALGPVLAGLLTQHLQVRGAICALFAIMVLLAFISLLCRFSPQQAQVRPLTRRTCLCESCKDDPLAQFPGSRWSSSFKAA